MIKAVIFDLDNTLVDFMKMKKHSCDEAMHSMIDAGLPLRHEAGIKVLFELYDRYGLEYQKIFQEFLKKTIGKIDWKILANGVVAYRRIKNGFLEPYPHVHSTLLALKMKGIRLAIVSDAPRLSAWTRLAAMRLTDYFDVVVTFEDTGKRKPHALPFRKAMETLKLPPEHVLMVGDWPEKDIKGAKKFGMKTCFARYGYHQKKVHGIKADYVIDDIRDILRIF